MGASSLYAGHARNLVYKTCEYLALGLGISKFKVSQIRVFWVKMRSNLAIQGSSAEFVISD
jgi:hypothetical protein